MATHSWIAALLLGAAVAICSACSIGVLVMKDAYQRLNFSPAVVSLAALLITIAIFVEDSNPTVRVKTVLVMLVLFFMNGVLSHVTARAIHIRRAGRWAARPANRAGPR